MAVASSCPRNLAMFENNNLEEKVKDWKLFFVGENLLVRNTKAIPVPMFLFWRSKNKKFTNHRYQSS